MQVLYERCAAVDAGKDVIAVAVRLPGDGPDGRQTMKRTFKTFYGVLAEAARWLTSLGVTHVAMEATGIYSMPVYHALIEHGDFVQVLVSRVSELCGEGVAGPGVVGDLRGWGLAWPYGRKSGGEELAAEPGEHVGGAGLGLGGVPRA